MWQHNYMVCCLCVNWVTDQWPVTFKLWKQWSDWWFIIIHICYLLVFCKLKASSEKFTLIWTMLLSDWCYLIKLCQLRFVHIRTVYSKDISIENLSGWITKLVQTQRFLSLCFTITLASEWGKDIKSKMHGGG